MFRVRLFECGHELRTVRPVIPPQAAIIVERLVRADFQAHTEDLWYEDVDLESIDYERLKLHNAVRFNRTCEEAAASLKMSEKDFLRRLKYLGMLQRDDAYEDYVRSRSEHSTFDEVH